MDFNFFTLKSLIITHQNNGSEIVKGSRIHNCGIKMTLSKGHEFLKFFFICLKTEPPKRTQKNPIIINLPHDRSNQGRLRWEVFMPHLNIYCHKQSNLPSILRTHFFFLKIMCFPISALLSPLPLLKWYVSPKFYSPPWVTFLWTLIVHE